MDHKEALAKLRSLDGDGVAELVSVVAARIESLETDKFQFVGEKRNVTQKNQALTEALEAIGRGLDLQGGVDELLDQLPAKVQELKRGKDTLQQQFDATAGKLAEVEGKAKSLERQTKLGEVAAKAGASIAVLEKLFGDQIDDLTIANDGVVKLGDKPLKEHVEADEGLKAFAPALFPGGTPAPEPEKPKTPSLPGGSPDGADGKKDLLAAYASKTFSGAKALTKKAVDS